MTHRDHAIVNRVAVIAAVVTGCVLCLILASANRAAAETQIAGLGSGAGQVNAPEDLAFDEESELLYVADRDNQRIDVFTAGGTFVRAFGWGVSNGAAELQTCTSSCLAGIRGAGAGQFSIPSAVAVDNDPASPSHHDLYVFDAGNARVQKLTPTGSFIAAWGGGVITAGAEGSGDLTAGSKTITAVNTTKKAFLVGQTISGAGIPPGAKIAALGPGTITLSKAATATAAGVALSVAEGAGNTPINEVQRLAASSGDYRIGFSTPVPSDSTDKTPPESVTPSTTAAQLQALLEGLSNIDPGDVAVSGPTGGPFEVEFSGHFADTDVSKFELSGSVSAGPVTLANGHSAATVCTAATDCVGGAEPGTTGSGAGQFGSESGSGAVAVGQDGTVHVGASQLLGAQGQGLLSRVQVFDEGGTFVSQFTAVEERGVVKGLAVDAAGASYVGLEDTPDELAKFSAAGTRLGTLSAAQTSAVALDASGNLFAGTSPASSTLPVGFGGVSTIEEFDTSGAQVSAFYGSLKSPVSGLVAHSSPAGDLYVSEGQRLLIMDLPDPGPIVRPETTKAASIKSAKATLEAAINPEGEASTYHFEYVDDATYQAAAPGHEFDSAQRAPAGPGEDPTLPADFELHKATVGLSGLLPATKYHIRAVADNASGTYTGDEGQAFTTNPPLEVLATYSGEVGTDSAKLSASANPLGTEATGYFEYVDQAGFEASEFDNATRAPLNPLALGAGEAPVTVSTTLAGLAPDSTYHYRFLATDHCKPDPEVICTFEGPGRSFKTLPLPGTEAACPANEAFRTGASARLPDCRAYEMVSPLDKNNGDIRPLVQIVGYSTALNRSAADGEGLTYTSYRAFGGAKGAPYVVQYMARRTSTGWANEPLGPFRDGHSFFETNFSLENEFKAFSPDLSKSWLLHETEPVLDPQAPSGYAGLYRREGAGPSYHALSTAVPQGVKSANFYPELHGMTADGATAVFTVLGKLTTDASEAGNDQVYVSGEEGLRPASVLPSGQPAETNATAGSPNLGGHQNRFFDVTHALSGDGSALYWTQSGGSLEGGELFLRENPSRDQSAIVAGKCTEEDKACTVAVSTAVSPAPAHFEAASADGLTAIYKFTAGAPTGQLYEYDTAKAKSKLIATKVIGGLLGASEDASRLYFASEEALTGKNAQGATPAAGGVNLYFFNSEKKGADRFRFIGTLTGPAALHAGGPSEGSPISEAPFYNTGHVSPDGNIAVFPATASLTGYDNADASTGEPDAEVYRYDASASEGKGLLVCVSCNPSGARPVGRDLSQAFGATIIYRAAAMVPTAENVLYTPTVMSGNGRRVFFNAYDSLVLGDTNGKADVYQWEAPGEGGCEEGTPAFSAANEGCITLISTGQSRDDSEFLDSSASGKDVFFTTAEGLVPQDSGLIDAYDARVGGGYPPPSAPTPSCEGEACQGPLAPPNDPTPASSSFEGAGNVKEGASRKKKRHQKKRRHKAKAQRAAVKHTTHEKGGSR